MKRRAHYLSDTEAIAQQQQSSAKATG